MIRQNQAVQAILGEHDDEGIGAAARLPHRIERIFDLFSCGEDYGAMRMNDYLGAAKEELIKDRTEEFGGARRDLEGWHGDAAENFANYLNQLEDGVNLMIDRIDTLHMILEAHQVLVKVLREDVLELVRYTLDGIAAAETDGWEVGASVVGAVAGFAGAVAGAAAGGPPGAILGMIAASMAQGAVGVVATAHAADSELGVIVEFVNTGEDLLRQVDLERLRIEKAFRALAESVTDNKLPEVRPERPVVITAPDFRPETFGLDDQTQRGHRVPTDARDLVPEPTKRADGPYDRTAKDGEERDRYAEQGPA